MSKRVLVVDDEDSIVQLCSRLLRKEGYVVRGVTSGREGIACLETENFDLLVLDIKIPDVHGLIVLKRGKELSPDMPVVVITGYATPAGTADIWQAGAWDILFKPFTPTEFISAIRAALERASAKLYGSMNQPEGRPHPGLTG